MIGYEKPIIYLGGEYIGYRVKDNEKLAPDDNELCPMTNELEKAFIYAGCKQICLSLGNDLATFWVSLTE